MNRAEKQALKILEKRRDTTRGPKDKGAMVEAPTVPVAQNGKPSKKKVTELQVNLALTVGPVGSAPTDPSACTIGSPLE